jgi:hypothetical protein
MPKEVIACPECIGAEFFGTSTDLDQVGDRVGRPSGSRTAGVTGRGNGFPRGNCRLREGRKNESDRP